MLGVSWAARPTHQRLRLSGPVPARGDALRPARPAGAAVRRRCPRGPVPPPEGRMPQPAGVREGARVQEHLRADRH
ncbi:hypothetical protein NUU61_005873 [Penicillium alfredii]|uniref:Uncharacterized protein n=1 Tax=Penicillium alfredii TaxID=1506179 RepID=A0A9W9FAQ0_9EURO|nr:uncharacterized protein NUU61_005862 [Penicillium alfredii]XP_056512048.1 uncharacterized protein NUU61_005873 [Penicillium alfredii]KAJ5096506.1 hypothetical protein NUU61_005862 [Penicillium alfredii]KAJ5096517.1 hypothetical protein NUU61_005873 [Penicillium alfredii]